MEKIFQDYFMQEFYENLVKDGYSVNEAKLQTNTRFNAYDNGKDVIFVKQ